MDSNAKYLMYKIYAKSDKLRANELRDEIILKYPQSKFAKILKNPNNLKIEKEFLIQGWIHFKPFLIRENLNP